LILQQDTTSSVFPQLFLNDIFKISEEKKKVTQKNIQIAINKLKKFQKSNGGFSYWQNENDVNDWATSYVGHFLLEAEKKGFVLPLNFKNNWLAYQKKTSERWNSKSNQLAQSYRLYTLALAGQPNKSAMNRLREQDGLEVLAKLRLAAAYAAISKESVAEELINNVITSDIATTVSNGNNTSNYGSNTRNYAMILETLVLLEKQIEAKEIADIIASALTSDTYMSTQTTSYSLLAMSKYAKLVGNKGLDVTYSINGKRNSIEADKAVVIDDFTVNKGSNAIKIKNNKNGNSIDVTKIQQGTNFVAKISLTNNKPIAVKDVAMTSIFPSGWEIINTRYNTSSSANSNITYKDIRDDRVNYYFDLKANGYKEFKVLLNASYLGNYYLPGLQGEAMYDDNFFVRTKGEWVEVTK